MDDNVYVVIEQFEEDTWEFAVWQGERQLALGVRETREDCWASVCDYIDKNKNAL